MIRRSLRASLAVLLLSHCQAPGEDGVDLPGDGNGDGAGGSYGSGGWIGSTGGAPAAGGTATGGAVGVGGAAATGGVPGSGGAANPSPASDMPSPGAANVAKPLGGAMNFEVLNWAAFQAAVSFTFDDALSSQTTNYAALDAVGVPLTFYVVSGNNGSNAMWDQAVLDGHEIGNHTAHHCRANGTDCAWGSWAGNVGSEFDQCTTHIQTQVGQAQVWSSASPYGDTGYASAASSRFLLNRGVAGGQVGANDGTSPYALPCQTVGSGQQSEVFDAATNSARSGGKWQIFLIHSLGGDNGYNPITTSELVQSITYAKNVGDVWADSLVHVGAYWRAQKLFSTLSPASVGSDKVWTWTLPDHFPSGRFLRVRVGGGTLWQDEQALSWDAHGYYEVALDAGTLRWSP